MLHGVAETRGAEAGEGTATKELATVRLDGKPNAGTKFFAHDKRKAVIEEGRGGRYF